MSISVTGRAIEHRYGARALDVYAMTELGVVGWTCREFPEHLHLDDRMLKLDVDQLGELIVTHRTMGTPLEHIALATWYGSRRPRAVATGARWWPKAGCWAVSPSG